MSRKPYFTECPRCGSHSFEHLSNHAHCPNCLHFEDYYEDTETCYGVARSVEIRNTKPAIKQKIEEKSDEINQCESQAS